VASDSEVINAHIRAAAADQHTSIPARVVSYNGTSVTVSADIDQQQADGTILKRGEIINVPVQFAGSSDTLIAFPLKAGHTGMLVFQERSMDEWVMQGADNTATVASKDRRMHDYNDCVFVPGVAPHAKAKSNRVGHTFPHDPQNDTVIKHNIGTASESVVKMTADGAITLQNTNNTILLAADGTLTITCKTLIANVENDATINCDNAIVNTTGDATVDAGGAVDVTAGGDISVDATNVAITSSTLKHNGVNVGSTHVHGGVFPGLANTSVPS